jgi:hypothetical protein
LIDDIPEGDDFIAVECGYFNALALRSNGSVVAWGPADGGPHDYGQVTEAPSGNDFVAIAAGAYFSMAIEDADHDGMGSLVGWGGAEEHGQLPTPGGDDFVQISVGEGHCLALREDGTLEAWGYNAHGQGEVPSGICNRFTDIEAEGYHNLVLGQCEWKLLASDGGADDYFGRAVAVSGDTAILGAPRKDDNGSDSGAAYVFRFDGASWVEEAKLLASDGEPGDQFGTAVAVCGDTVAVSAVADDDNGTAAGAVYVFRHDGFNWIKEAKLLASDGAAVISSAGRTP